jgi:hypothetical protein
LHPDAVEPASQFEVAIEDAIKRATTKVDDTIVDQQQFAATLTDVRWQLDINSDERFINA